MEKNFKAMIGSCACSGLLLLICVACAAGESPSASSEDNDTLYQLSTLNSLMAGNYDGIETAAEVSQKGDFGIGTFDGLDGEMVMLDGEIYQVKASGEVETPDDSITFPFLAVTHFDEDTSLEVTELANYDALKAELDKLIVKKDRFYAVKVTGVFDQIQVRSVPKQEKPYPVLSEVTKNQPVFDYEKVEGTLVGFWCPDYVGSLNVPGYHLHFISNDHSTGGHLLEVVVNSAKIVLDETPNFEMELSDNAAKNELEDAEGEIEQVEK